MAEEKATATVEAVSAAPVEALEEPRNLQLIMDIPLRVTVELGRTKMVVSELLNLGQGSVIELNKLAGEPMEVLVNDKLVARGEAVVVNEKFGVRLTDIISPAERVEQLK
jgi:flagellar motor switch protein FliN/FliY